MCLVRYDASYKSWNFCAPMQNVRSNFGIAVIGNLIYAAGGTDFNDSLNSVEHFVWLIVIFVFSNYVFKICFLLLTLESYN